MLMYAAGNTTNPGFLEAILAEGADIGKVDCLGRSAFHFACKAGQEQNVKLLLEKLTEDNEDLKDAQTEGGVTPFMLAVESMNYDLVTECLNSSMNPFLTDALGREAIDYAGEAFGVKTEKCDQDPRDLRTVIEEAKEQWLKQATLEEIRESQRTFDSDYFGDF